MDFKKILNWLSKATGVGYQRPPDLVPLAETPEFVRSHQVTQRLIAKSRRERLREVIDTNAKLRSELQHLQRELRARR